jgi:hypothetical protein
MSAKKFNPVCGKRSPKMDNFARSVDLACSAWLKKRGLYFPSAWKPRPGEEKLDRIEDL